LNDKTGFDRIYKIDPTTIRCPGLLKFIAGKLRYFDHSGNKAHENKKTKTMKPTSPRRMPENQIQP